ncbi:hypothetical protein [Nocardia sp. NPDC050710]|uniref:hypothetical protein n=1 Tax=Nocardia sp. NPDC050710 TaxID=3157220 RepID=UPI00340A1A17
MTDSRRPVRAPAPPWLLFWLAGTVAWTIPHNASQWWSLIMDLVGVTPKASAAVAYSALLRIPSVVDLVPVLVVLAAVATVFGARLRGRIVEHRYRLEHPPDLPTVAAISAFALAQLATVDIRVNLRRTDLLAMAYFHRLRQPRLAIFGPLTILWRKDRPAAEAVILHEIGHCRQGDNILLGAVSPLEWVLKHWLPIAVATMLVPVSISWGIQAIDFLHTVGLDGASHKAGQFLGLLFHLGLMLLSATAVLLAAIAMPAAGSWSAELNADYIAAASSPAGIAVATARIRRSGLAGWAVARLTHPPTALRRSLLRAGPRIHALGAIMCYPLGWLVVLGCNLIVANANLVLIDTSPSELASQNRQFMSWWLQYQWPLWLAAAAFVILWPAWCRYWQTLTTGSAAVDQVAPVRAVRGQSALRDTGTAEIPIQGWRADRPR